MERELYHPGLRGVVAGETDICSLDDGLRYRGYCIYDLVQGASFLEVAYLLLHEQLPDEERFADFVGLIADEASLPDGVPPILDLLPLHISPLEALRLGINLLAHCDPQPGDSPAEAGLAQATRLIARLPILLATLAGPAGATNGRQTAPQPSQPKDRDESSEHSPMPRFDSSASYAHNLYRLLLGTAPTEVEEHALEVALILAAEHEFTPSSFAARLAGSTQADVYSAVQAALSTFIGSRHNGAERSVLEFLDEIENVDEVDDWVARKVAAQERVPGFGHPVFTDCDPRAAILEPFCARLAAARKMNEREELAETVEQAVWDQQRLPPNIDWPLGRLLELLGFRRELHAPIFVCARVVGWCAHALEQAGSGEAIRPRARYRGVDRADFAPLWKREM
jgi:citrate synthase